MYKMKRKNRNKLRINQTKSKIIQSNLKGRDLEKYNQREIRELKKIYPNDTMVGVCCLFHITTEKEPNGRIPKKLNTNVIRGFTTQSNLDCLGEVSKDTTKGDIIEMMDTLYLGDGFSHSEEMMCLMSSYLSKTSPYKTGKLVHKDNKEWGVVMNFFKYRRGLQSNGIMIYTFDTWMSQTNDMINSVPNSFDRILNPLVKRYGVNNEE